MTWRYVQQTFQYLFVGRTRNRRRRLGPMHHLRIPIVHHGRTCAVTRRTPSRSRHPLKDRLVVKFELAKASTHLELLLEQTDASARVFFGVVPALAAVLDLAAAPLSRKPRQAGFQRPSAWVVIDERGVNAEWMTDFERFEVRLE